ncbi:MAG: hypothetical protein QOD78_75, partial [Chloroflexota bacterium]|nr:hypothetical protein [Chloroflexota bacterium]
MGFRAAEAALATVVMARAFEMTG